VSRASSNSASGVAAAFGNRRPLPRRRFTTAARASSEPIASALRSSTIACCDRLRCSARAAAAIA